jgi:parvulin-like peptidyl-prolyl isomerase
LKRRFTFLLIASFCGFLGCMGTVPRASYLASVNQDLITMEDLRQEFKKRHGGHEKFLAGEVEIRKFLSRVVDQKLLLQEAYRLSLQEDPAIQEAAAHFQAQKLREYIIKKEVEEKSKATEEEIKAVYEKNMEEIILVQQIVVKSKEEAEEILKRIQSGEEFEAIARERSIAPSKKYGGRLPPTGWGFMEAAWERVAFSIAPGEISPIIKSRMGYEIIRLDSRKASTKPEFKEVRSQIKAVLDRRQLEERGKAFVHFLRNKYAVQMTGFELSLENLQKAREQKKEDPLATWEGGKMTASSFAAQLDFNLLATLFPDQAGEQIKGILEEVVNEQLMVKESLARGYDKVPEVDQKVRQYREGLMENKLYGNYILADMKVTDEELRQYFEQNRQEFVFPEKRRVAHILAASLDSAKDIFKKYKEGESFEALAKFYSKDSQNAERGGELGWVGKGDILPVLERTVFSLKAGEISDPVQTEAGHHILKLLEVRPAQLKDFTQAKKEVEKKVLQKKREGKILFWVDQLKAVAQVEINEEGIRAAVQKQKSLDMEKDKK